MKHIKKIYLIITIICMYSSLFSAPVDVGETFDVLMGKYTNSYMQLIINNNIREPWFIKSKYAYNLSRSLFKKYSIENSFSQNALKIPKIIHQICLGGLVPEKYAAWIETWKQQHPDWTYIMWMDHDIKYLHLVNQDLFVRVEDYREKSDILGLELLNKFGGLYIDTDYECLKPFDIFHYAHSFYVSSAGLGECNIGITNGLIGASQGHPLMGKLVNSMKAAAQMPLLSQRTGPLYFTKIFFENAEHMQKDVVMYPAQYFIPDPQTAYDNPRSYSIRLFDASWLRPTASEERLPHDALLEIALTPLFFKQKSTNHSKIFPKAYYDVWHILFAQLKQRTVVELGACNFIVDARMDLNDLHYIGISPVKFLVLDQHLYYMHQENRKYFWKDILHDELPACGLLIMGAMMEYLPYKECLALCENLEQCNAEFFIIAHDEEANNTDTVLGQVRSLNMCEAPFSLSRPHKIITLNKKTYGVWKKPNKV